MFYAKNLPNWERLIRVIIGTVLATTGLIGCCPMCAMVGRKLNKEIK